MDGCGEQMMSGFVARTAGLPGVGFAGGVAGTITLERNWQRGVFMGAVVMTFISPRIGVNVDGNCKVGGTLTGLLADLVGLSAHVSWFIGSGNCLVTGLNPTN